MSSKKSFILYLDQQDLFNKLPDEVAGKLIKHIFSYVNCEDPATDDLVLDIAFESIKQALKRDLKSWENQRQQRSNAGKKSAEARANKKQREATKSTGVESRSTKSTVSVNGSVSDTVNDNKKKQVKTSLPDNFKLSTRVKEWALKNNHKDLEQHLESFKLSCESKNYKYANWDSALMKAIRDNWAQINKPQQQAGAGNWELGSQ